MKRFKCKECGYIHIGDEAPDVCPVCGYDKSIFVKMDQVEEGENIAYAMIEELDVTSIKILRQLIDDTSEMAAVASAMAKRALMENNLDLEKHFNALALELLDQASIYMIYSGEFLEVTSSANRPELEKKLQNEMKLPVTLRDERGTTITAHGYLNATDTRGKKRKAVVDAVAATIILQDYLDFRRNHKNSL